MKSPVSKSTQEAASSATRPAERDATAKTAGGNQNLSRILRKAAHGGGPGAGPLAKAYHSGDSATASGLLNRGASTGGPLAKPLAASASKSLGADVSGVRVHTGAFADRAARDLNADAFAFGQDVYFRDGRFEPHTGGGRDLLNHELAHTVQHRSGMMGQSESLLERHADQMTSRSFANFQNAAAAPRILRKPTGAKCTSVTITLPHDITFHGSQGPIRAKIDFQEDVSAGDYQIHFDQKSGSLLLEPWPTGNLILTVAGSIAGNDKQIKAYQDLWDAYLNSMTANVPLKVVGSGAAGGLRAGDPSKEEGSGGVGKPKDAKDKKDAPPPAAPGGKKDGTGEGGDPGAEKKEGGEVKGGDPSGTPGVDNTPPPPPDAKVPVVQLTDIKQIEELKKRGVIDAKTADDIKAKLDKQENLTFEEAIALIDAMDKVVQKDPKAQSNENRENWLKWAKFIQENKDKISGKSKTADKGITIDEMKELLAKYHEFVGVKDAPPAAADKKKEEKDFDPAKRKGWNELQQWEKDLWTQYVAKHGAPAGASDSGGDLHLTSSVKFSMAMNMSPDYMSAGAHDAAVQLFHDPLFIGGTVVGIGLYIAAWLAPEPIFSKATAATITAALLTVFSISEIRNLAVAWSRLGDETEHATTLPELETAAEHFGKAMGGVGLRVLVMIATLLLGKALPTPKGPVGGGGGMAPELAPAGGPPIGAATAEGVAIKVLADGSILVLPAGGAQVAMASTGGGGGGTKSAGERNGPKPKEPEVPEDTHGLRDKPGGKPVAEGKEVGNFVHNKAKNFEKLPTFTGDPAVISEQIPPDAVPEFEITGPDYTPGRGPRIDRLDRAGQTVIELKPNGLYKEGLAEAEAYATIMDKLEPLAGGAKWKAKCVTYDYDVVMAFLKKIGYLP